MFITKRQQEALICLSHNSMYQAASQPGRWYSGFTVRRFFSQRTVNILIDAGWVGFGSHLGENEEVVALTPEGRRLAKLLSARK